MAPGRLAQVGSPGSGTDRENFAGQVWGSPIFLKINERHFFSGTLISFSNGHHSNIPSGNLTDIAIGNGYLQWIFPFKMVDLSIVM